ncbi:hypothetical protein [Bradyrhizobium sp. CCH5-F6]|uniref:hypothetical protein n=1 Tax=Bradyrhizobium sp. CCH5-F6 TaxID=1768753 RepID=UPI0012E343DE|nr:hypothetical protein [Bradyrhizobium sp. CCH5-F6]
MAGPVESMLTVTLSVKLPFWWRAYVGALKFFSDLGWLSVDPQAAADFVCRHTTVRCGKWRGKLSK